MNFGQSMGEIHDRDVHSQRYDAVATMYSIYSSSSSLTRSNSPAGRGAKNNSQKAGVRRTFNLHASLPGNKFLRSNPEIVSPSRAKFPVNVIVFVGRHDQTRISDRELLHISNREVLFFSVERNDENVELRVTGEKSLRNQRIWMPDVSMQKALTGPAVATQVVLAPHLRSRPRRIDPSASQHRTADGQGRPRVP
jgi:hypothetical protein